MDKYGLLFSRLPCTRCLVSSSHRVGRMDWLQRQGGSARAYAARVILSGLAAGAARALGAFDTARTSAPPLQGHCYRSLFAPHRLGYFHWLLDIATSPRMKSNQLPRCV